MVKKESEKIEKQRKFKPGELKEIIFAGLGIAVIIGGSIVLTPNFPIVLAGLLKIIQEVKEGKDKLSNKKVENALKRLEKRRIISLQQKGENVEVRVLEKGQVEVLKYSVKRLLRLKNEEKKWNNKWFLVVFDVPEEERIKRNYLRKFLTDIGFCQFQKSVYVYPYQCEEEISLIKKVVEGGKYLSYIVAERLENEDLFKKHFHLTS